MKHILIFGALLLWAPLFAQEEETIFKKATVHGGFGGPIFEVTSMNDQTGMMFGGGGGVIVNDFFIGGFGQGGSFGDYAINNRLYPISMGFGGLWLGYVKPTWKAVHLYMSLKIAGGGVSIAEDDDFEDSIYDEAVFVAQPEVGLEVNFLKWFRVAVACNYRIVSGVQSNNLAGLSNSDFNAMGGTLTLRFGHFYRED
jgi:hypothetical protein